MPVVADQRLWLRSWRYPFCFSPWSSSAPSLRIIQTMRSALPGQPWRNAMRSYNIIQMYYLSITIYLTSYDARIGNVGCSLSLCVSGCASSIIMYIPDR